MSDNSTRLAEIVHELLRRDTYVLALNGEILCVMCREKRQVENFSHKDDCPVALACQWRMDGEPQ